MMATICMIFLHDLAQSGSNDECYSIVSDDKSVEHILHTFRHLYLDTNNLNTVDKVKVDTRQQLHSLQLKINSHKLSKQLAKVIKKVFKSLKCVCVLDVLVYNMRVLPDIFGHLKYLRRLRILDTIDKLSISLCKLYNLQVLEFHIFRSIALPKNMKNFICLRHLVAKKYGGVFYPMIARIGKLTSLQVTSI